MSISLEDARQINGITVVFHNSKNPGTEFLLPKILKDDDGRKVEQVLRAVQTRDDLLLHSDQQFPMGALQDAELGMLGGAVEEGEKLVDALIREIVEEIKEALRSLPVSEEVTIFKFIVDMYLIKIIDEIKKLEPAQFIHFDTLRVAQWRKKETPLNNVEVDIENFELRGIISITAVLFDISRIPGLQELLQAIGFEYIDPLNQQKLATVRPYGQVILPLLAQDLAKQAVQPHFLDFQEQHMTAAS